MPHITEKELLMLGEDLLEHEMIIEKYAAYMNEVGDQQIKNVLQKHQDVLMQHYQEMLGLAQQGGYQQSGYGDGYGWQSSPGGQGQY